MVGNEHTVSVCEISSDRQREKKVCLRKNERSE